MKPFENFDFSHFWDDDEYSLEEYVGKEPTDEEIESIEKELGYKLPASYIELVKIHNGGTPYATLFSNGKYAVYITGIYGTDKEKMNSLCGEMGNELWINEWGYPNIGVAVADTISGGHHMVFLDYRECGKEGEPKVVLIDQEDDFKIHPLADNFEEFIKGLTVTQQEITKEEFAQYSDEIKERVIDNLSDEGDTESVIEFLTFTGVENLNTTLKGQLARAYNNNDQIEEAMKVLDMIPEEERDALWYYRYGCSYSALSSNHNYMVEEDILNSLAMLEKAMGLAKDDKVIEYCIEIVDFHGFKGILEANNEKFPLVYKHYKEQEAKLFASESGNSRSGKTYAKITVADIEKMDEIWNVLDPIYWTVDIYGTHENYLKSAEGFTLEQRYLNAVSWYFIEVNNGGHQQFLDNSTGIVWEDALNGLKAFDMGIFADNFKRVIDAFGGKIPFDREERWKAMEDLEDGFDELLEEADSFVYDTYDYDSEYEVNYVKSHPDKFVYEGYYNKMV